MKPILFNTKMVRAILDGRKTNTRRLINPRYRDDECGFQIITNAHTGEFVRVEKISDQGSGIFPDGSERYVHPPYQCGDILYVRENWAYDSPLTRDGQPVAVYMADYTDKELTELRAKHFKWKPSIHMPKELARLFLRVTNVRVERLNEITNEDVLREGVTPRTLKTHGCECAWAFEGCRNEPCANRDAYERLTYKIPFAELWDSTIRSEDMETCSWSANPWVWVIEYEKCEKPEGE